jgi:hypothetical protein
MGLLIQINNIKLNRIHLQLSKFNKHEDISKYGKYLNTNNSNKTGQEL